MESVYYRVFCNQCGWNVSSTWKLYAASLGLQHANSELKHSQVTMNVIEVEAEKWCQSCGIRMRHDKWRMPDRKQWYRIWHCYKCEKTEFEYI